MYIYIYVCVPLTAAGGRVKVHVIELAGKRSGGFFF